MQVSSIPLILLICVLTIYIVWKLLSPGEMKKNKRQRFSIRKHRSKGINDNEDE
jgi:uncharacterized membrane protein SpoIIM required for sporulation